MDGKRVSARFVDQVIARMAAIGMNKADLARAIGVSRPAVSRMLRGKANMRIGTMVTIASALDMGLGVVVAPPGPSANGCRCCTTATPVSEMIERHGTLERFSINVNKAVPEWLSGDQADAVIARYRHALACAPKAGE